MPHPRDNPGEILIVGCGRWFCCDDQVGLLVAQALKAKGLAGVRVIPSENPGADLPGCLSNEALLIVIDAAAADDKHPPGAWQRIDAIADRGRILSGSSDPIRHDAIRAPVVPTTSRCANTHMIGVNVALDLAVALDVLPETVWLYAIAIDAAERGEAVTPALEHAALEVTDAVAIDIHRWRMNREPEHA